MTPAEFDAYFLPRYKKGLARWADRLAADLAAELADDQRDREGSRCSDNAPAREAAS